MSKFIVGTKSDIVAEQLKKAGVIQNDLSDVRRIVIDLEAGSVAKIYVEMYADNERLAAGLSAGLGVSV